MTKQELFEQIQAKKSFLCVGLDTDVNKIPEFMFDEYEDPIFEFNKAIIDATADLCVAYKPNLAFYESMGLSGWDVLDRTVDYIRTKYPEQFIIADAKRGDIGNTSAMYARTFWVIEFRCHYCSSLYGRRFGDSFSDLRRQMGDSACPDFE
jgi:orotidine-5'-phosphate decarboxylase